VDRSSDRPPGRGDLAPDQSLAGRYRLIRRVGSGGMADVWEAIDETLRRTVAVKVIRKNTGDAPQFAERFVREARLVASLEHPNILPIFDLGNAQGVFFIVMPLVPGGSLTKRLRGPVASDMALKWLGDVARALDFAHSRLVLHRDVKPANVLLDDTGKALLTDFGIAKSVGGETQLTTAGSLIGTPLFMSPELIRGERITGRADQYALAVIGYVALSGRPPFEKSDGVEEMQRTVHTEPPPPSRFNPKLARGVDAVLLRAMSKDPAQRYPSCSALVEALERATQPYKYLPLEIELPPKPEPPTEILEPVAPPKPASIPRPPLPAPPRPVRRVAPRPPPPPPRRSSWKNVALTLLILGLLGTAAYFALESRGVTPGMLLERLNPRPTPVPVPTAVPTAPQPQPQPQTKEQRTRPAAPRTAPVPRKQPKEVVIPSEGFGEEPTKTP